MLLIIDAVIGSLKSLHTLFGKYLVKIWQRRMVRNLPKFEFWPKTAICEKVLTPFWMKFLYHKHLFNAIVLIDYHLSLFKKKEFDTCEQVKSCIKLDRPNQYSVNKNLP